MFTRGRWRVSGREEQWPRGSSAEPLSHVAGTHSVSQNASGMNGIQMEIKESCDCYVVYTEEKPIGKYPLDVLESDAITKHNAEEVQALCYLKFLHRGKTMRSIQREIVWGIMLISVVMGVNLTCVTWSECVTSAVLYQSPNSLLPRLHIRPHLVTINASMASNGYTIWWREGGTNPSWLFPSVPFQKVKELYISLRLRKEINYSMYHSLILTYFNKPSADMWAEKDESQGRIYSTQKLPRNSNKAQREASPCCFSLALADDDAANEKPEKGLRINYSA